MGLSKFLDISREDREIREDPSICTLLAVQLLGSIALGGSTSLRPKQIDFIIVVDLILIRKLLWLRGRVLKGQLYLQNMVIRGVNSFLRLDI